MRRSIATVSMSGTLRDKLEAIAAARFDGYELFENDLLYFSGAPREAGAIAADLGISCELYQPFRDFEGMPDAMFRRNLERAERKFDVMEALGAPIMLVCSNTSAHAIADEELAAAQLYELAERAAKHDLRIGYEALAWGRVVNRYRQSWSIVKRADHPRLGVILDSFHVLSLRDDPSGIVDIPGEKIFFVQMADAPLMMMDVLQWARHFRNFPGQGQLDVESFFEQVLLAGYAGPLSLEIFNDIFRETPNRRTAIDAMRSLRYLEGSVRHRLEATATRADDAGAAAKRVLDRIELFDPPAAPVLSGFAFLEFAVDDQSARELAALLQQLGFRRVGRHRSMAMELYRQGAINLVLNTDAKSFARDYFLDRGPTVCALGLRTDDPVRAVDRAIALQSSRFETRLGEMHLPAIRAPGGIAVYFVPAQTSPLELLGADFALDRAPASEAEDPLLSIDHVAYGLPTGGLDSWVLFCGAVLGMDPGDSLELADPFGLVRSTGVASADRSVRLVLNVSSSQRTRTARAVGSSGGTLHHIALATSDILSAVARLRARGVGFVPISPNYYDDLLARLDLDGERVDRMRELGIVYDSNASGEYLHAYTAPYAERFFFEIVQRAGRYDGYGAMNAAARLASQAEREVQA
jgi:4-hydroxyphenylpyruvate dioxygenase